MKISKEDKTEMYMKLSKEELVKMVLACQNYIGHLQEKKL